MSLEARNRNLTAWFHNVEQGTLVLPRFQRFEAWSHQNVGDLFNTVLQGLPIGAMLVLEIGNEQPFISRAIKGAPETDARVTENLLDGQQRLTALWRGLYNNYETRTYYFVVPPTDTERIYVESKARWQQPGDKELRPIWLNSPNKLWAERLIPLDLVAPGEANHRRLKEWLRLAIPDPDERETVTERATEVRVTLANYNIPFLSLPPSTSKDTALGVFIKMNTSAEPLSTYDIVVAQIEAAMGQSLHDLVANTKEECPLIEAYYGIEDLTLYAGALLQGKAPIESTYLSKEFGPKLLENWDGFIQGVKRTVAFLEEERVFDNARLPTEVVIPVLVSLWASAATKGDAEGRARSVIRKYLWRSFFTARYERATNSRTLSDSVAMQRYLSSPDGEAPEVFSDDLFPLPEVGELLTAAWPKKKDRLARAILAVAIRKGGIDLADGSTASRGNLARREYHHVYPDAHLSRQGLGADQIYRSLNCALVTWSTNRTISDKEPERYLAERRDNSVLGEAEVRHRLASHLIPYDEMVSGDYQAYIQARAVLVYEAMLRLCNGEGV